MKNFLNTAKFHASYFRFNDHSNTYRLKDWSNHGMDARKVIDALNLLPDRIHYHSLRKKVLTSAGINQGTSLFITSIEKFSSEGWGKGTRPFIASARLKVDVWVKLCSDREQIEIILYPLPMSQMKIGKMYRGN